MSQYGASNLNSFVQELEKKLYFSLQNSLTLKGAEHYS